MDFNVLSSAQGHPRSRTRKGRETIRGWESGVSDSSYLALFLYIAMNDGLNESSDFMNDTAVKIVERESSQTKQLLCTTPLTRSTQSQTRQRPRVETRHAKTSGISTCLLTNTTVSQDDLVL